MSMLDERFADGDGTPGDTRLDSGRSTISTSSAVSGLKDREGWAVEGAGSLMDGGVLALERDAACLASETVANRPFWMVTVEDWIGHKARGWSTLEMSWER